MIMAPSLPAYGKLSREFRRLLRQSGTLTLRPFALATRCRFVFILGHMRSGSTLLCHLLCSSGEIIGFGETHTNYHRRSDLAKLLVSVWIQTTKNPLRYKYVLDKIVDAQHVLCDAVLRDQRTRYVLLVREPLASMASIVAMRRQFHEDEESLQQSIEFAANHYAIRLSQLVQLAKSANDPTRCLLVTHRQLLTETPLVFQALEAHLHLREPLREDYQIMPTTGKPGIGDPSPNILLGKISRTLPRKHLSLPPQLQSRLEDCYQHCIVQLQESATIPDVARNRASHAA